MSTTVQAPWESKRTPETRDVEQALQQHFSQADAYRFNPASIRVRVVDDRFKGKDVEERDEMVERVLTQLPEGTQRDIINLLTIYPGETADSLRAQLLNLEFEDPSQPLL
jgi:stress-induced morphogen